jgi:hypothetical protein
MVCGVLMDCLDSGDFDRYPGVNSFDDLDCGFEILACKLQWQLFSKLTSKYKASALEEGVFYAAL